MLEIPEFLRPPRDSFLGPHLLPEGLFAPVVHHDTHQFLRGVVWCGELQAAVVGEFDQAHDGRSWYPDPG